MPSPAALDDMRSGACSATERQPAPSGCLVKLRRICWRRATISASLENREGRIRPDSPSAAEAEHHE